LLGDTVAVLAAPGKLVAQGTPVELKSSLGSGYTIMVTFEASSSANHIDRPAHGLLEGIKTVAPSCQMVCNASDVSYQLGSKDPRVVQAALREIDAAGPDAAVQNVDVQGPTLEGVFLDLMTKAAADAEPDMEKSLDAEKDNVEADIPVLSPRPSTPIIPAAPLRLELASGRPLSFLHQTLTVFYKRVLIVRRAWLTPLLALVVAILGACIPLTFVRKDTSSCARNFTQSYPNSVFLPTSFLAFELDANDPFSDNTDPNTNAILEFPAGILSTLGSTFENISTIDFQSSSSLSETIKNDFQNLTFGGISFEFDSGQNVSQTSATFAWQASYSNAGLAALNLVNNILYNRALNVSDRSHHNSTFITASYASFPYPTIANLVALKWVAFFGAAMVCSSIYLVMRADLDESSIGRISCVFLDVRLKRKESRCTGDAAEQRFVEFGGLVAWSPDVRLYLFNRRRYYHHNCFCDHDPRPIPWSWSFRKCYISLACDDADFVSS
jgi:ATP-binding cassette, subfamily A (ABC1), member 3